MNLLCPHCQKMLSVSEQYAGQLMKCPHCANAFTAPSLPRNPVLSGAESSRQGMGTPESVIPLAASPDLPPHPEAVGSNSTTDGPVTAARPQSAPPAGYARTRTIWISPRVMPLIPPAALVLVFVLTFFPWIRKVNTLNFSAISKSAWTLGFGDGNVLMLVFLILFIVTLLLTVAAAYAPRATFELPRLVHEFMPWRAAIVAGALLLTFLFLFLQTVKGFSDEGQDLPGFVAQRSVWLRLSVTLIVIALIAAVLDFWLLLRKSRPLPRIDISW